MKKITDENGNVVIEASIVVTIAVVMVVVMINLGLMIYQQSLIDAVAKETAVSVANVYACTYRDPIYGYIDDSEFYKTDLYRYVKNVFTGSHTTASQRKGEWYGLYKLKTGSLMKDDSPDVSVVVDRKPGTLIQHQVVVTIETEYEMPLTAIWGGNNKATYKTVAKADCIDLLDYFNTIGAVNENVVSKIDDFTKRFNKYIGLFNLDFLG